VWVGLGCVGGGWGGGWGGGQGVTLSERKKEDGLVLEGEGDDEGVD